MKRIAHLAYVLTAMTRGLFEALVIPSLPRGRQRRYWDWRLRRESQRLNSDSGAVVRRTGALSAIAELEVSEGNLERAASLYREALATPLSSSAQIRPADAWLLIDYAEVLLKLERLDDARAAWKRVVEGSGSADDLSRECREVAAEQLKAHPDPTAL